VDCRGGLVGRANAALNTHVFVLLVPSPLPLHPPCCPVWCVRGLRTACRRCPADAASSWRGVYCGSYRSCLRTRQILRILLAACRV
jgi:hypothetical protein